MDFKYITPEMKEELSATFYNHPQNAMYDINRMDEKSLIDAATASGYSGAWQEAADKMRSDAAANRKEVVSNVLEGQTVTVGEEAKPMDYNPTKTAEKEAKKAEEEAKKVEEEAKKAAETEEVKSTLADEFKNTNMTNEQFVAKAKEQGLSKEETLEALKAAGYTDEASIANISGMYDGEEDKKKAVEETETETESKSETGDYNAGNLKSVDNEINDIATQVIENSEEIGDKQVDTLYARAEEAYNTIFGNTGKDYIENMPKSILKMHEAGEITKDTRNLLIADSIFTALGNISTRFTGKGEIAKSKYEEIVGSKLAGALERHNAARDAKLKSFTDIIDGANTMTREQQSKAQDLMANTKVQTLLTAFNEAEGVRLANLLVDNAGIMDRMTPELMAHGMQIQLLAGSVDGQAALVNIAAELGMTVVDYLEEHSVAGILKRLGEK